MNQSDVLLQTTTIFEQRWTLRAFYVAHITVDDLVDAEPLSIRKTLSAIIALDQVLMCADAMSVQLVFGAKLFAALLASEPRMGGQYLNISYERLQVRSMTDQNRPSDSLFWCMLVHSDLMAQQLLLVVELLVWTEVTGDAHSLASLVLLRTGARMFLVILPDQKDAAATATRKDLQLNFFV
jgi:hypothetical protein